MLIVGIAPIWADQYIGRVTDLAGEPIAYATVYVKENPMVGTATGSDGIFRIETDMSGSSTLIISFIGYEKEQQLLATYWCGETGQRWTGDTVRVQLREQPIELEEMVISAKASKQKNKRKQMEYLLHQVEQQMAIDFSEQNYKSRVVSDVRMDSEGEAWGIEQMIGQFVTLPHAAKSGSDSIQYRAEYCKRYFSQRMRDKADTILAGNTLEKMGGKKANLRQMANAVDSGVVVHKALWAMGNIQYDFKAAQKDVRHWSVSQENEGETVLTHTEKKNYLGVFKYEFRRNYIVDSETLSVTRFSEQLEMWVSIPFGYKLSSSELQILNLMNMRENDIEKFRLRRAHAVIRLNTIYSREGGKLYPIEKNLKTEATMQSTKGVEIPIDVKATQRVTALETEGVEPMRQEEITRRIRREIVGIY